MNHANTHSDHRRVIVALDFPTSKEAFQFTEKLDPKYCHLKVGMTMFTLYGPAFVDQLIQKGFSIFLDLKFHDIPHQVAGACRSAAELGVWMLTIHTLGGVEMCEAAANALAHYSIRPHLIGITILTSAAEKNLAAIGINKSIQDSVRDLTKIAQKTGLNGIVCSAWEAADLRKHVSENFLLVTPGIRLAEDAWGDQQRVMTPQQAFQQGADYIVVGRSITQSDDPAHVLKTIIAR